MKRTSTLIVIVVVLVLAFVAWEWRDSPFFGKLFGSTEAGQLVAQVNYQCNAGKTISASFYNGPEAAVPVDPNTPPTPTGSATVALSDGRTMTLAQTISADGTRYANKDESFVFWSKGNGALVLENNEQQSYIGCIKVADNLGSLPQVYESGSNGISLRYPANYAVDESYVYQNLGPGKDINGVKFTIDPAIATGTNLSSDSYVAVEQIPQADSCTADKFLDNVTPTTLTEGDMTYSYASSSDAGAGNRYEEQVFALPGTNPCIAMRYFIHYGAIENYPQGAVTEFNHDALVSTFDAIRDTLTVVQ